MGSLARLLPAAAALLATPAFAETPGAGWYAGAAYSNIDAGYQRTVSISQLRYVPRPHEDGFKVIGGYRALDWLAIEANYSDLGHASGQLQIACIAILGPCPNRFDARSRAFSLSAIGEYPIGPFAVFARLGVAKWHSRFHSFNDDGSRFVFSDDSGTDPLYGAGVALHGQRLTTRLEYEHHDLGEDDAKVYSLGVTWSF